jgi:hypothetical protein
VLAAVKLNKNQDALQNLVNEVVSTLFIVDLILEEGVGRNVVTCLVDQHVVDICFLVKGTAT